MNEIKFLKSLSFSALVLGAYFALQYYVFDDEEIDVWAIAFIPLGKEVISLVWKYYQIWEKRNEKSLVSLKLSKFEPSDIVWALVTLPFVMYFRIDLIKFFIPLVIVNFYLLYAVKKNQRYFFSVWTINDLVDSDKDINTRDIISIEIQSNKLEILYVKDEYKDKSNKNNQGKFIIERHDLDSPRSWYQFEQIIRNFENSLEKKREEHQKKTAILDS